MIYDRRFLLSAVTSVTLVTAIPASEPIEFPKLDQCASLWERSLFTTKDLPAPEAPAGPSFVDNLALSGIYELKGEVVTLIVDKSTSQVFQAKIGSENEIGVKVRKITGEIRDPKVRVQLQKGDQVGWVKLADATGATPQETVAPAGVLGQPAGLQTRQAPAPPAAAGLLLPPNQPASIPQVPTISPPTTRREPSPAPVPAPAAVLPQSPPASTPPAPVAVPKAASPADGIPLPPP